MKCIKSRILATGLLLILAGSAAVIAQEILLDKLERVGELVCFQSFDDEKVFYYLPDKPRVAEQDGRPQFSFMKFVTNVDTGGEGGTTTAQGGGIVHFLVEFSVEEEMVRRAEQELGRRIPNARIAGPLIYRSGTFSLISTTLDESGEYASKVLGLGKAPIMEGHKAAVSILLTRQGATLLWENFKMTAPDISLQFEMEVAGYREPFEAEVSGDWSLIARNRTIAAGLKTTWMGIDIQNTLKELQQENAIRVVQKGSDEASEKLVSLAYGKLVEYIFEQVKDTTVTQTLATDQNLFSNFEKAAAFNYAERARVAADNRAAAAAEARASASRMGVSSPPASYPAATRHKASQKKTTGKAKTGTAAKTGKPAKTAKTGADAGKKPATGAAAGSAGTTRRNPYDLTRNRQTPPSFSLLAAYRMKTYKTSGTFKLTFNKFTLDKLAFPIAENVGDLYGQYGDDPSYFREVNLDDPVYRQRELIVFLDGQDFEDFDKYINFVTVTMRKDHDSGEVSTDELRIDRENFQEKGNHFRMLYGWKGDEDRDAWLQYQYKTHWSLHGGAEYETNWIDTNQFSLTVAPPHRYRQIALEADPDTLEDEEVRMVTVKFYYSIFGKEQEQTVSMRAKEEDLNKVIEYTHEPNNLDYEYEITWRLRGGKKVSTGRLQGSDEFIFCDELPSS